MNASPQQNPSQGSTDVEKAGKVLSFAEAKLKKELQKGGIAALSQAVAPYALKLRTAPFIRDLHEFLSQLPQAELDEFIDRVAGNSVDQAWYKDFTDKLRLLLPGGIVVVPYGKIKDYGTAFLLLTGTVGGEYAQEQMNERAQPGVVERILAKALPWVVKFDIEPDTRLMLEAFIKLIQVKGLTIEALTQLRKAVRAAESADTNVDLNKVMGDVEDLANYAGRMPGHKDHKEPEEINLDNAMGPESRAA